MGKLRLADHIYHVSSGEMSKIVCDNVDGYLEIDGVLKQVFLKINNSCDREQMLKEISDEYDVEDIGDVPLEDALNGFLDELKIYGVIKEEK